MKTSNGMKKIIFLMAIFLLSAGLVLAQDEVISASDLGVVEPTLLPDSPFYFLKEWGREIGNFFTFNPMAKAERQLRQANEKLIEAKLVAEKTGKEEIVARAMEKYEKAMEKAGEKLDVAKERAKDDSKFQNLMDKFVEDGFKHHRLITVLNKKIENVSDETKGKIKEARGLAVAKMGEVLSNVDGEKADERINRAVERIKGSQLAQFKNLEVLKELEEKLPEQALPAIRRAQDNAQKRLKEKIEEIPIEERKEKLENYIQKVSGNETRHLEILEDLRFRDDVSEELLDMIDSIKEKSLIRINERIKKLGTEEAREMYLGHLSDGTIEKMKVLKQIENNLDEVDVEKLKFLKEQAVEKFKIRIEDLEKQREILNRLKAVDVGQLEVIEELGAGLPEDKRAFVEEMRAKAFSNLKENLDKKETLEKKELFLKKVSGDDPKQIEVLKQVQIKLQEQLPEKAEATDVLNRVIKKQADRVDSKIGNIEDLDRLEVYKKRIDLSPETKKSMPDLIKKIDSRREVLENEDVPEQKVPDCPQYSPVSSEQREKCIKIGGKMESKKDAKGCWGPASCILPTSLMPPDPELEPGKLEPAKILH